MFAHEALQRAGLSVFSSGTGSAVRLPGPSIDRPNIYTFGTPYDAMYKDLAQKDTRLYEANGLLHMLDRNRRIKLAPERWQENRRVADVVITCEERCFDSVCEGAPAWRAPLTTDLLSRRNELNRAVHVINVDIKDNHEDAELASHAILKLAQQVRRGDYASDPQIEASQDPDEDIDDILERQQQQYPYPLLHTIAFY